MSLRFFEIAEANVRIHNPINEEKLMQLGAICRPTSQTTMLDLACGAGELLCLWSATYGMSGIGIDLSEVFTADARRRAAELKVSDRVTIIQGDAARSATLLPELAQHFDIVSCVGASWIGGGLVGTLKLMRPFLKSAPNSLMLAGEPFWSEPPTAEAMAALESPGDLYCDLPDTVKRFNEAGYKVLHWVAANLDTWDEYQNHWWMNIERWLRENPNDPDAAELKRWGEVSKQNYLRYERRYLGWATFVIRPADL
jgi:SAM-dependent methyltransferase